MTQTTGPEFKGGIHPLFNTVAVQAEAVADPDVYPDFLNPDTRPKSIVKPRDPKLAIKPEDMVIDSTYAHLDKAIDRRSKSVVIGSDPDFVDPNLAAEQASERAWDALETKKKEHKNEVSNNDASSTSDALKLAPSADEALADLTDSRYPVLGSHVVEHEAQINLTDGSSYTPNFNHLMPGVQGQGPVV